MNKLSKKVVEYKYEDFEVKIMNSFLTIKDKFNDLTIGAVDGRRFELLKDAINYLIAQKTLEDLKEATEDE